MDFLRKEQLKKALKIFGSISVTIVMHKDGEVIEQTYVNFDEAVSDIEFHLHHADIYF